MNAAGDFEATKEEEEEEEEDDEEEKRILVVNDDDDGIGVSVGVGVSRGGGGWWWLVVVVVVQSTVGRVKREARTRGVNVRVEGEETIAIDPWIIGKSYQPI
ncbi:hypothetical protein M0802_002181 [Mischocyttarus mexicanus]|nr:hypothetical protein M0802_002181 [Mischocyttarus mexicanus]